MKVQISLIPPALVTDRIVETAFCGLYNESSEPHCFDVELSLFQGGVRQVVGRDSKVVGAHGRKRLRIDFPTAGFEGRYSVVAEWRAGEHYGKSALDLEIRPSTVRSTERIGGAWAGLVHWSEEEGRLWNDDIRKLTDNDWRGIVRAMADCQIDILVIQELFRNQAYVGGHRIEEEGYAGRAFYPSRLYPLRADLRAENALEAILDEADRLGVKVLPGIGLYAWFDFTEGSLAWHKRVASEVHELYGFHPSFYGWYVSEEVFGNLGETLERKKQLVDFFRGFQRHVQSIAPEKPVMLAPNCHGLLDSQGFYDELLPNLDIVCPFGFHRMPEGDLAGEQAAECLQTACDRHGTHLWLDMEAFLFGPDNELYPRPIDDLIDDMKRFPNFEKILIYQFPGLMSSPSMRVKLGGEAAVRLYQDYSSWLQAKHSKTWSKAH